MAQDENNLALADLSPSLLPKAFTFTKVVKSDQLGRHFIGHRPEKYKTPFLYIYDGFYIPVKPCAVYTSKRNVSTRLAKLRKRPIPSARFSFSVYSPIAIPMHGICFMIVFRRCYESLWKSETPCESGRANRRKQNELARPRIVLYYWTNRALAPVSIVNWTYCREADK